jgi:hypothetical protein
LELGRVEDDDNLSLQFPTGSVFAIWHAHSSANWGAKEEEARVCSRVKQIRHHEHVQTGYILGVGATPLSLGMASGIGDQHYGMRI